MKNSLKVPMALWALIQRECGKDFEKNQILARSILEMHMHFTENRGQMAANYFKNKNFNQAYLAYYLPLNFLKLFHLYHKHQLQRWLISILKNQNQLHFTDFGCGPGTATLALLWFIKEKKIRIEKPVKITLFDVQKDSVLQAVKRIQEFANELKIMIEINAQTEVTNLECSDIFLFANTLNELKSIQEINPLISKINVLAIFCEPSHRVSSQKLIRLRESLLKTKMFSIVGPCTHIQQCPLYKTDHWCHFAEPLQDARWEKYNRFVFKNSRHWLKFSYLILEKTEFFNEENFQNFYRVIGDPYQGKSTKNLKLDLCKPNEKWSYVFAKKDEKFLNEIQRGSLIKIKNGQMQEIAKSEPAGPSFQKNQRSRDRIKNEPEE